MVRRIPVPVPSVDKRSKAHDGHMKLLVFPPRMREIYRNLDVEIRPMAQPIVRSDADDVTQRLALLGLQQLLLLKAQQGQPLSDIIGIRTDDGLRPCARSFCRWVGLGRTNAI